MLHPGGAIVVVTTSFNPTIIEHPKHEELNNAINEVSREMIAVEYVVKGNRFRPQLYNINDVY